VRRCFETIEQRIARHEDMPAVPKDCTDDRDGKVPAY
jgi:hypothetical protein